MKFDLPSNSTMKIIPLFVTLLLSLFVSSCATTGLKTINGLAKLGDYSVHKNISYTEKPDNQLDIYVPSKDIKAVIVFYYGGCWGNCTSKNKADYLFIADTLTKQGYAVVIPDCRQYPDVKFHDIMDDAEASFLWSINHLQEYKIETDNIYVMGHSSGAHVAAMLVDNKKYIVEDRKKINGFIGLAGPYDFYPFDKEDAYLYDLFSSQNNYYASQPINHIDGNEPPHLILHGKNDKTVFTHNAVNITQKLKQNNTEHQLVLFEKMKHVNILVSLSKPLRKNSKVLKHINSFIEKYNNH